MVVELTLTNSRVSGDRFTLVKQICCCQCTTQFHDRLDYPSKITFFPVSVFFTGFSFSTAMLSRKVVLPSPPFLCASN